MNFANLVLNLKRVANGRQLATLLMLLFSFFWFPQESNCEFYKYRDKNGKIHFVDSKTKIPREYRKDLTSYEEKYDHLSEEERDKKIAEDRQKLEEKREKEKALQLQQLKKAEEQRRREIIEEEEDRKATLKAERQKEQQTRQAEFLKNFETKVEIVGYGQALVPCILVYNDREVEAKLLLDTGCSITTIHEKVAKKLRLKGGQKGKASVAGGGKLSYKAKDIDYIKVGPHKIDNFLVMVIKNKNSRTSMEGLLGMNFLAGLEYKLDYVRKVIRWVP